MLIFTKCEAFVFQKNIVHMKRMYFLFLGTLFLLPATLSAQHQHVPVTVQPDGIGANEYIVTVTQNAVDIFSTGDTPAPWELNMWYHTLNCGFRPRLSGETDFPCIFDGRVGIARSYFKPTDGLSYPGYVEAIKSGRSYISDGRSHIIDFSVNGLEMGTHGSELHLISRAPFR
jgi:hypothetical protein